MKITITDANGKSCAIEAELQLDRFGGDLEVRGLLTPGDPVVITSGNPSVAVVLCKSKGLRWHDATKDARRRKEKRRQAAVRRRKHGRR